MNQNLKNFDASVVIAGRTSHWAEGTLIVLQDGLAIAAYKVPADEINAYGWDLTIAA